MTSVLLCVDDRTHILQLRKATFERLGFAVATATTVAAAMTVLENIAVAAVLLEYRLKGLDAEAVAVRIKRRFPNTPVLLLSAYSDIPQRLLQLIDVYTMKSEPVERIVEIVQLIKPQAIAGKRSGVA